MSFMEKILAGASYVMMAGVVILVIAAAIMVTWWGATEGSVQHEDAKR